MPARKTDKTDKPATALTVIYWGLDLTAGHRVLLWLGVSVGMLRLGPAGIALALSSNAATYLVSKRPLNRRYQHYKDSLARTRDRWHQLQDAWLTGDIERTQRDASIEKLLDEFAHAVEHLREQLHSEESPD